ncbi:hypothetical protein DL98DRAFT_502707 [Cadophora sp. DSE1049]|nr:hypothetical protein DL98DRAFT_502707 [Cadophora sp. DSE1049]
MNGVARHTACKLCRDRKVRCSGEQPACETCQRAGEECVYVPACRPNKVDLVQTVETLQERLDKAEDLIRQMESQAQTNRMAQLSGTLSPRNLTPIPSIFHQSPHFTPSSNAGLASEQISFPPQWFGHNSGGPPRVLDQLPDNYFFGLQNPIEDLSSMNEAGQFRVVNSDVRSSSSSLNSVAITNTLVPSLREVRELNSASEYPLLPTSDERTSSWSERGESNIIAAELTAFTRTIFSAQSDIAGISLVLAEYLEYIRKAPKTYDHSGMLEKLESRAREVHDLARTRHYVAWKNMVATLESLPLGSRLRELEGEVCRHLAQEERFFHGNYDMKASLYEQRKPKVAQARLSRPTTSAGL